MKLLIDAGNSRVKWALHDGLAWGSRGVISCANINQLFEQWRQGHTVSKVYGVSVASQAIQVAIEQAAPGKVNWVLPERQCGGVNNHYYNLDEQGADRWLTVLAARERYRDDLLVVSTGTALTIESLTRHGDYLGGSILPGYALMLSSLANGTARLDRRVGAVVDFPRGTEEAIASGVIDGLVGAIERARARLARHTGCELPRVVLTGGDVACIATHLAGAVDIVDNLVLEGLLRVTSE